MGTGISLSLLHLWSDDSFGDFIEGNLLIGHEARPYGPSSCRGMFTQHTSSNGSVLSWVIIWTSLRHFRALICQMMPLLDSDRQQTFLARWPVMFVVWNYFMMFSRSLLFSHLCTGVSWKPRCHTNSISPLTHQTVSDSFYFRICKAGWVFSFLLLQFQFWSNSS